METVRDVLVRALTQLHGQAPLKEIYAKVGALSERPYAVSTIRAALQQYGCFYNVYGAGARKGWWGLEGFVPDAATVDLTTDDAHYPGGRRALEAHIFRERDPRVSACVKEQFAARHGRLSCEACGFFFEDKYGALGEGFIEAHHTGGDDFLLLCSNCHSMAHRKAPGLKRDALDELFMVQLRL